MGKRAFTGEMLPVFYVRDVDRSVQFYRDILGFEFHRFWDHGQSKEVRQWAAAGPPVYAEMAVGDLKFALHLAQQPYELQVGGVVHYFRVQDVDAHHRMVAQQGGEPSALVERPWMRMFSITDPDGHRVFFYSPPGKGSEQAGYPLDDRVLAGRKQAFMEANSGKGHRWHQWSSVGAFTLAIACTGILLFACMRLPDDQLSWEAHDSTPTPTVTPRIRISPTPTRTPLAQETPAPYCRPAEASISLSPSATELKVDQTLTVTVRLVHGETSEARLGRILYRLRIEPNILAMESDEAVEHTLTLDPGDWDRAEFVLRALEPGQVTLSGWASYEMHALDYS